MTVFIARQHATYPDRDTGADTVLKLGAQTPAQSAGKFFLNMPLPTFALCPQFRGNNGAYHSGKNRHCENNTS